MFEKKLCPSQASKREREKYACHGWGKEKRQFPWEFHIPELAVWRARARSLCEKLLTTSHVLTRMHFSAMRSKMWLQINPRRKWPVWSRPLRKHSRKHVIYKWQASVPGKPRRVISARYYLKKGTILVYFIAHEAIVTSLCISLLSRRISTLLNLSYVESTQ